MGVFHAFQIVQMVPNRATHHIYEHQMKTFNKAAKKFFEKAFRYALDNLSHQDQLLFYA